MVVDPKVLVGIDDDDGLGACKISFGESFFLELAKVIFFIAKELAKVFFSIRFCICLPPCRNHSHLHMFVSSSLAKTIVSCVSPAAIVIVSCIYYSVSLCRSHSFLHVFFLFSLQKQ